MSTSADHPWQLFPSELIRYALDHLRRPSEFDQIVGFLLLDVGVETLLKVFLLLPEEVTKTNMSYHDRKKAAEGNFHELLKGVKKAAKTAGYLLQGINLEHVEYFHGLRNKLYHAGNGITVQGDHAEQYKSIAMDLLDRLLGVDVKASWQDQLHDQKELDKLKKQVEHTEASLRKHMYALEQDLRLAIERIEPAFVMPSFERKVEKWENGHIYTDPSFFNVIDAVQSMDAVLPAGDVVQLSEGDLTVMKFKSNELRKLTPPVLQRFVDRHNVDTSTIARLLTPYDFFEFLLLVADAVFKLPVDMEPDEFYALTKTFPIPQDRDESIKDWLTSSLNIGRELICQAQEIHDRLRTAGGLDHETKVLPSCIA